MTSNNRKLSSLVELVFFSFLNGHVWPQYLNFGHLEHTNTLKVWDGVPSPSSALVVETELRLCQAAA